MVLMSEPFPGLDLKGKEEKKRKRGGRKRGQLHWEK